MPVKFQPSTIFTTFLRFLLLAGLVSRYMSDSVPQSSINPLLVSAVHVCRQISHIAVN
jgi:hypothetical protein